MVDIAIIGAGGIARTHVNALSRVDSARIVAVYDLYEEKARALAASCGAMACTSPQDCIARADMVYVLTPPSRHREYAVAALAAGRHVVCEKPLASSIEDAETMVEASHKAGLKLMTAFNMRFRRGFGMLRDAARSGRLGRMLSFWSQRLGMGVGKGYNWRTDPDLLCGMVVESLSHDVDLIRWIAGEVIDARASTLASRENLPGFDDNANVVLTLADGSTALIHASWSSHLARNSRGIVGTRGTALVEGPGLWELREFHLKTEDMEYEAVTVINDAFDVSSYIAEDRHFVDCVEKNLQPSVTGEDGLQALRISQAILTSHREQRVVSIR